MLTPRAHVPRPRTGLGAPGETVLEAGPEARADAPGGPEVGLGAGSDRPARGPAWWRVVRVRQWSKNLLVLAAPLAAGRVADPTSLWGMAVALGVFCLASAGCYLVNDACDAAADRSHPTKRFRPVAAGEIAPGHALAAGSLLMALAVVAGGLWTLELGLVMLAYLVLQVLYMNGLKAQPAIDLAVVSSGFLLRAVAGGVATGTPLSPWFLLVATFGALFVVAGKRYSEMSRLGPEAGTRESLRHYSASYLRFVWTLAAAVTVMVYLLWALSGHDTSSADGFPWAAVSVAPFVLCLMRYAARVDRASAEHPEDIVLGDRHLQVVAALWLGLVVAGAVQG